MILVEASTLSSRPTQNPEHFRLTRSEEKDGSSAVFDAGSRKMIISVGAAPANIVEMVQFVLLGSDCSR